MGSSIFGDLSILSDEILAKLIQVKDHQVQDLGHLVKTTPLKKGEIREYVDLTLDKNLDELTVKLLLKLKELYFKRKLKVPKGRKQMRPAKKRYIIGLNEVLKHLQAGNLTCVIMATNLEKVEQEKGIDDLVSQIAEICRKNKIPLIYSLNRYRLGCAAKYKGQKVSACGIMNY